MIHTERPLRVLALPAEGGDNPYAGLLYRAVRAEGGVLVAPYSRRRLFDGRWDIVHIHWPAWLIRTSRRTQAWADAIVVLSLLRMARARGAVVAWTAHDLRPHDADERPVLDRFMRAFAAQVDLVLGLSASSLQQVRAAYPVLARARSAVTHHGHFRDAYPDPGIGITAARRALGLPEAERIVLFIGQIRPYKDVPALVRSFLAADIPDAHLVVAGRVVDEDQRRQLLRLAVDRPQVSLVLERLDDREVALYLRAADLVVLPYRAVLNSGAALLSLSCDRPVLVPETGSLGELRDEVGPSWVHTFRGNLSPEALRAALDAPRPAAARAPLEHYAWNEIGAATVAAYRAAIAVNARPGRVREWARA